MAPESIETVIIGGGQAGLSASFCLAQLGREHVVLEQAAYPAVAWRDGRWDSFTLVTPNWFIRLPGGEYQGSDPDGFLTRDEVVGYFADYIQRNAVPIRYDAQVTAIEPEAAGGYRYRIRANGADLRARNVIVATGAYQAPKVPPFADNLSPDIIQITSGQYRRPEAPPPGAVLVAGSAQSGCQIAEELYQAGRKVYLCIGTAGRAPRRYRGKDIVAWLMVSGFMNMTADKPPSARAKFAGNPHVSGKGGGHNLNLHQFARDGVTLLGRIAGAEEGSIQLSPDLHENLARVDRFEAEFTQNVDKYIAANGLDAPEEALPALRDGFDQPQLSRLDLKSSGISTIIWALGYRFDYRLVRLPVTDADGYPVTTGGVTEHAGLYFLGMPWLSARKSGLLGGVGEDARAIAGRIAAE